MSKPKLSKLRGRYVVYEVWTASRIIEADDDRQAYQEGEPDPRPDLNLCNWHIVKVPATPTEEPR